MIQQPLFLILVFGVVLLLFYALAMPSLGGERAARKRVNRRMNQIRGSEAREVGEISLARQNYLQDLSAFENKLESLPFIHKLAQLLEQAGKQGVAYRAALLYLASGIVVSIPVLIFTKSLLLALGAIILVVFAFIFVLVQKRAARIDKFDEQLPDALGVMIRALRAGYPFTETLSVVGDEMPDPVGSEFAETFVEISYGYDTKTALYNLLARIPSVSLMALVTAVMIQRDTGGNLAEILEKISELLRARFKLQRKVKTLSAEGRLSGWILGLLPFVLTLMIHIISPDYLPRMFEHPLGEKMIIAALVFIAIGILWMRRIIRIDI